MKKALIILILSLSFVANAQIYNFDKIVTVQSTINNNGKKTTNNPTQFALNSENPKYTLNIYEKSGTARISDIADEKLHEFYVDKNIKDGTTFFKYESSRDYRNRTSKYYSVIKTGENEYSMKIFTGKKRKNTKQDIKVTLVESPTNLYYFYAHISGQDAQMLLSKLKSMTDPSKKYVIQKTEIKLKNELTFTVQLKKYEEINLTIKVPEK